MKTKGNKYYQLVKDINNGALPVTTVVNAISQSVKESKMVPDNIKDLYIEIIESQIRIMNTVLVKLELAYRRGKGFN